MERKYLPQKTVLMNCARTGTPTNYDCILIKSGATPQHITNMRERLIRELHEAFLENRFWLIQENCL
jgi:hypothetical protein